MASKESEQYDLTVSSTDKKLKLMGKWDPLIDFTGGTLGGVGSVYTGQSLDTVKVKMQTFPQLYRNAWHCFVETYKQDGIRGLYAGTVPSLIAQVAENAVLFAAYGACQKGVMALVGKKHDSELNFLESGVSGSLAGFFAAIVLTPTELVKCKLQAMKEVQDLQLKRNPNAQLGHLPGPYALTKSILKSEGVSGMFRGFTATCSREMPGYFFFFAGYEVSRNLMTPTGKSKEDLTAVRTLLCGGIGGMSLWTAIFPFDVIKSRVQVDSGEGKTPPLFRMLIRIAREEGVAALYKGLGPTLVRTFITSGVLFLIYEETKSLLSKVVYE